jgi:hypothetical protein
VHDGIDSKCVMVGTCTGGCGSCGSIAQRSQRSEQGQGRAAAAIAFSMAARPQVQAMPRNSFGLQAEWYGKGRVAHGGSRFRILDRAGQYWRRRTARVARLSRQEAAAAATQSGCHSGSLLSPTNTAGMMGRSCHVSARTGQLPIDVPDGCNHCRRALRVGLLQSCLDLVR